MIGFMAKSTKTKSFEEIMKELELIITRMEQGEINLDESLSLYEKGIALTRECNQQLQTAQLKMEELKAEK